ncbi:MAG: hypothetical protein DMG59_03640 [Acidobacteria bacterium]|nr:MAG: hypothetical protein DMG59_03640 [Acidobacteriota bacterium]
MHVTYRILVAICLTPPLLAEQDPAILQIRVIEGEGAVYPIGSRATRGITVQVTDETGKPVENATVSLKLPEDGPGGVFSTGAKTEIATTRADGRAGVWGMQWNRTLGAFEVRITAMKGPARAGIACPLYLTDTPRRAAASPGRGLGPRRSRRWVWISLAAVGAAGAGVAARAASAKPAAASASGALQIGTPVISLGRP